MIRLFIDGIIFGMQPFGGISKIFSESLSMLNSNCTDIDITIKLPTELVGSPPQGERIHYLTESTKLGNNLTSILDKKVDVPKLNNNGRPHIFHSTYYTRPLQNSMKIVTTVYDFVFENISSMNQHSFIHHKKAFIEEADAVIAISNATKNDILKYTDCHENKIEVIYPGLDQIYAQKKLDSSRVLEFKSQYGIKRPYWLYVGRMNHTNIYKNFNTVLKGWALFSKKTDIESLLVIITRDNLEPSHIEYIKKQGLSDRVIILQNISNKELRIAYHGAIAFIFPSLAEGFGIPIIEAMACHTPMIVSDIPVFREIASDAALFFNPLDVLALSDAMVNILNKAVAEKTVENGKRKLATFSWANSSNQLANVYRKLINDS